MEKEKLYRPQRQTRFETEDWQGLDRSYVHSLSKNIKKINDVIKWM